MNGKALTGEYRDAAGLPSVVPATPAPVGLPLTILESQVDRLLDIGAFGEVRIGKDKYRDELMAVIESFEWRPELAAIGLDQVALVHYRLRGQFLAEAGGVYYYIDPDKCKNYGVETPSDKPMVIQGQWGPKYRKRAPRWCRNNFHPLEQGLVVKEGLTVFLYEGKPLLDVCFMDFSGSVSGRGSVPSLYWVEDGPGLSAFYDGGASPDSGSASRGKCLLDS